MFTLLNAALYQAGWLACTLGAAHGLPWMGPVAAAGIVGWHLARARRVVREGWLIALAALCGLVFETTLLATGWIAYPLGPGAGSVAPLFMIALWALFATTFNVSLRFLRERPAIAAAIGAVGGPAAYYAGARLGALQFVSRVPALVAIGLGWALAAPALLSAARRLDGYAP